MQNCNLYKDIGQGQYHNKKYKIWSILKNEESVLVFWYVVLFNDTSDMLFGKETYEDYLKFENELTDKSIDVRKLPNYKDLNTAGILFNDGRRKNIVPMIKEAVRKGYICPV